MSFFDQLAGSLNKVTKDISSKAQEISDTAKLNSRISDANALLKSTFAAIGEAYYEKNKDDESNEFADQFRIVAEAKASIEEYRSEVRRLKGVICCEGCGSEIPKDASFCPKCGAKVVRPTAEQEAEQENSAEKKYCRVCHAEMDQDAQFCVNCGASADEADPDTDASKDEE